MFSFAVPPVKSTKSVDARQPSYFGEVFPSDYTDFDTESEFDDRPRGRSLPAVMKPETTKTSQFL